MELNELAKKHFGSRMFSAADLIGVADVADLPGSVQYAIQEGGDSVKSLGIRLRFAEGVEKVAMKENRAIWRAV